MNPHEPLSAAGSQPPVLTAPRPKRKLRWRIFCGAPMAVAGCALLLVGFVAEENWRGARAWANYKSQQQANGTWVEEEKASAPAAEIPQVLQELFIRDNPGPPEGALVIAYQRLDAQLPWSEVSFNWSSKNAKPMDLARFAQKFPNGDIVAGLNNSPLQMDEVAASLRAVPLRFSVNNTTNGSAVSLNTFLVVSNAFVLRAEGELAQHRPDLAMADVETNFRMEQDLLSDSTLTAKLVSVAIGQRAVQVIWDGLAARQWTEEQLAVMQADLARVDIIATGQQGVREEERRIIAVNEQMLAKANPIIFTPVHHSSNAGIAKQHWDALVADWLSAHYPRGWVYFNLIASDEYFQKLQTAFDVANHRFDQRQQDAANHYQASLTTWLPYTFLAATTTRNLSGLFSEMAINQQGMDEALVACAIERFRLANGKLPQNLADLTPKYLAKIPHDVFDGSAMRYERQGDDQFTLTLTGSQNMKDGKDDEVWTYPASAKAN